MIPLAIFRVAVNLIIKARLIAKLFMKAGGRRRLHRCFWVQIKRLPNEKYRFTFWRLLVPFLLDRTSQTFIPAVAI